MDKNESPWTQTGHPTQSFRALGIGMGVAGLPNHMKTTNVIDARQRFLDKQVINKWARVLSEAQREAHLEAKMYKSVEHLFQDYGKDARLKQEDKND